MSCTVHVLTGEYEETVPGRVSPISWKLDMQKLPLFMCPTKGVLLLVRKSVRVQKVCGAVCRLGVVLVKERVGVLH